jgi:hypothetical protein
MKKILLTRGSSKDIASSRVRRSEESSPSLGSAGSSKSYFSKDIIESKYLTRKEYGELTSKGRTC